MSAVCAELVAMARAATASAPTDSAALNTDGAEPRVLTAAAAECTAALFNIAMLVCE
jgi:hypothetical protein